MKLISLLLFCTLLGLGFAACGGSKAVTSSKPAPNRVEKRKPVTAKRSSIVHEAKRWLGTPYRYGGTTRAGIDCSGFTSRVYDAFGITLPRSAKDQFEAGDPVSGAKVQAGDLVFFQNTAGRGISHVGVYIGNGAFIHASTRRGVVISSFADNYYRSHYAGARTFV